MKATRIDSSGTEHRVRFPALHTAPPLEVQAVNAYLDTDEGREFVEDCRAGRYSPQRPPRKRRRRNQ